MGTTTSERTPAPVIEERAKVQKGTAVVYTNPQPIDRVLERLEGVKGRNGSFTARCPNHSDNDPSLSIGEGDDGRILLKCFAGCGVEAIVAAIGLEMHDLFASEAGGEGGVYPLGTGATVQHPPENPHENAENTVAPPDATLKNGATPPEQNV